MAEGIEGIMARLPGGISFSGILFACCWRSTAAAALVRGQAYASTPNIRTMGSAVPGARRR